jgi:hypothetical protein
LVWALGRSIWPYLDVVALGLGTFLVYGRVGCLLAGCCHGRPHRWGVRYRSNHAADGFTPLYVGVRLFPIQAIESLWVLGAVVVGSGLVLRGSPSGSAFAWYVTAYGSGRFVFEFARGDATRAYLWGFSEAQWTSLLLLLVLAAAERTGIMHWRSLWPLVSASMMVTAMGIVATQQRRTGSEIQLLLHPRHMFEVAAAVDWAIARSVEIDESGDSTVHIARTSLGLQISVGTTSGPSGPVAHYTISREPKPLTRSAAERVTQLIVLLRHPSSRYRLVATTSGSFHLVFGEEKPPHC